MPGAWLDKNNFIPHAVDTNKTQPFSPASQGPRIYPNLDYKAHNMVSLHERPNDKRNE